MVSMSFGDHIEELRARLILALLGLIVGVVITFIPPLNLGKRIIRKMQEPAQAGAARLLRRTGPRSAPQLAEKHERVRPADDRAIDPRRRVRRRAQGVAPKLELPEPEHGQGPDRRAADADRRGGL